MRESRPMQPSVKSETVCGTCSLLAARTEESERGRRQCTSTASERWAVREQRSWRCCSSEVKLGSARESRQSQQQTRSDGAISSSSSSNKPATERASRNAAHTNMNDSLHIRGHSVLRLNAQQQQYMIRSDRTSYLTSPSCAAYQARLAHLATGPIIPLL